MSIVQPVGPVGMVASLTTKATRISPLAAPVGSVPVPLAENELERTAATTLVREAAAVEVAVTALANTAAVLNTKLLNKLTAFDAPPETSGLRNS